MTPWPYLLAAIGIGCCALAQRWWRRRVQQSEHRYRRLVERAPVSIAVVAADGHMRSANPAFCKMLSASPTEQTDVLAFPHWSRPGSPPICIVA